MSTIELEAQKACLAREILCIKDETIINNVWLVLRDYRKEKPQKREIGFL